MRALAAVLILTACAHLHAHQPRGLETIRNIVHCGITLGPSKCLNALTVWQAERAIKHPNLKLNFENDLQQFPWNKYRNNTEEELYFEVCDGTEKLLQRKALSLTMIPGYRLELLSKGNGTLSVDVYKNVDTQSGRSSMKKAKKTLSQVLPFLVLPGLLMSAILPFFLPALKFMVFTVGMLNNMALSGAVFTLLRNNAFNDRYEHKVIYVNEGYKNEKHANFDEQYEELNNKQGVHDNLDIKYAETNPGGYEIGEIEPNEELPLNADWANHYYDQNVQFTNKGHEYK